MHPSARPGVLRRGDHRDRVACDLAVDHLGQHKIQARLGRTPAEHEVPSASHRPCGSAVDAAKGKPETSRAYDDHQSAAAHRGAVEDGDDVVPGETETWQDDLEHLAASGVAADADVAYAGYFLDDAVVRQSVQWP